MSPTRRPVMHSAPRNRPHASMACRAMLASGKASTTAPHFNPDDITRHVGVYNKRGLRPDMEYGTALLY